MKKQFLLGILFSSLTISSHADQNFSAEALLLFGVDGDVPSWAEEDGSTEGTPFGFRVGYMFNPNVAVEVSYQDYGKFRYSWEGENYLGDLERGSKIDQTSAVMAGIKLSLPLKANFTLVGRFGASSWESEYQSNYTEYGRDEEYSYSYEDTTLYYGVGLQFNITESVFLGAEYLETRMEFPEMLGASNYAVSLGYAF